jgi:hypothetical protein
MNGKAAPIGLDPIPVNVITFLDVVDGKTILTFQVDEKQSNLAFSPDGFVHSQVKHDGRILTSTEADANPLEFLEGPKYPLLSCRKDIYFNSLFGHFFPLAFA